MVWLVAALESQNIVHANDLCDEELLQGVEHLACVASMVLDGTIIIPKSAKLLNATKYSLHTHMSFSMDEKQTHPRCNEYGHV